MNLSLFLLRALNAASWTFSSLAFNNEACRAKLETKSRMALHNSSKEWSSMMFVGPFTPHMTSVVCDAISEYLGWIMCFKRSVATVKNRHCLTWLCHLHCEEGWALLGRGRCVLAKIWWKLQCRLGICGWLAILQWGVWYPLYATRWWGRCVAQTAQGQTGKVQHGGSVSICPVNFNSPVSAISAYGENDRCFAEKVNSIIHLSYRIRVSFSCKAELAVIEAKAQSSTLCWLKKTVLPIHFCGRYCLLGHYIFNLDILELFPLWPSKVWGRVSRLSPLVYMLDTMSCYRQ